MLVLFVCVSVCVWRLASVWMAVIVSLVSCWSWFAALKVLKGFPLKMILLQDRSKRVGSLMGTGLWQMHTHILTHTAIEKERWGSTAKEDDKSAREERTQEIKMEQDEDMHRQKMGISILRKGQNEGRLGNVCMRLQCSDTTSGRVYTQHITNEQPLYFFGLDWRIFLPICAPLLSCTYKIIIICCLLYDGYFHSSCNYALTECTKAHIISSLLMWVCTYCYSYKKMHE